MMSVPGATFKIPQGEKMQEILEKLQDVSLDPHKEAQIDAAFQESEIILNNLKIPYPELKEQHEALLLENSLIRGAVKDLRCYHQLSLAGKERAIPFLAEHCHRSLRIESFLQALKIPTVLDGNLKVGSRQYHVGQKTASLLKKYCEEALKHLETHKNQLNWLSRDIYFETQAILKQLIDFKS